jgi:hypothetical protein
MIRIAGARDRTVMSKNICKTTVGACGCWTLSNPILKNGLENPGSAPPLPFGIRKTAQMITSVIR